MDYWWMNHIDPSAQELLGSAPSLPKQLNDLLERASTCFENMKIRSIFRNSERMDDWLTVSLRISQEKVPAINQYDNFCREIEGIPARKSGLFRIGLDIHNER